MSRDTVNKRRSAARTVTSEKPLGSTSASHVLARPNSGEIMEGEDPERQRKRFLQELRQFLESKGNLFTRMPCINGKQLDLHLLYSKVTERGGWCKVTEREEWYEIAKLFDIPLRGCANMTHALKQIYVSYLGTYEKVNFFGEDEQADDTEETYSRSSRDKGPSLQCLLPVRQRHFHISSYMRSAAGMSLEFAHHTDYDKLCHALISGLPNEVDFAVNVCTLLSNETKHVMQLDRTPRIVDLLLAQIGIFEEGPGSLQHLYSDIWNEINRDYVKFWIDAVPDAKHKYLISSMEKNKGAKSMCCEDDGVLSSRDLGISDPEGQRVLQIAVILRNLSFEEGNAVVMSENETLFRFLLLCVHCKWSCLRQISLDTLGNLAPKLRLAPVDETATRHMLQTINSCIASSDKFQKIRGMEILAKLCLPECNEDTIAENLELCVYEDICTMLTVQDIMLIVYTLEVLYQLSELGAKTSTNIAKVHRSLDTLVDLVTIEAQSFGPNALQGMKVIEAGPAYLMQQQHQQQQQSQYQVPQQRPGAQAVQQQTLAPATQPQAPRQYQLPVPPVQGGQQPVPTSATGTPTTYQHSQHQQTPSQQQQQQQQPIRPAAAAGATPSSTPHGKSSSTRASRRSQTHTVQQQQQQQQQAQSQPSQSAASNQHHTQPAATEVSLSDPTAIFTSQWLQSSYEYFAKGSVSRTDVYADYVSECKKLGKSDVLTATQFLTVFTHVFPTSVTQQVDTAAGPGSLHHGGIRKRENALPTAFMLSQQGRSSSRNSSPGALHRSSRNGGKRASSPSTPPVNSPQHRATPPPPPATVRSPSLLQQQLSQPPQPSSPPVRQTPSPSSHRYPSLHQMLLSNNTPPGSPSCVSTTLSSTSGLASTGQHSQQSLIKNLLSKVPPSTAISLPHDTASQSLQPHVEQHQVQQQQQQQQHSSDCSMPMQRMCASAPSTTVNAEHHQSAMTSTVTAHVHSERSSSNDLPAAHASPIELAMNTGHVDGSKPTAVHALSDPALQNSTQSITEDKSALPRGSHSSHVVQSAMQISTSEKGSIESMGNVLTDNTCVLQNGPTSIAGNVQKENGHCDNLSLSQKPQQPVSGLKDKNVANGPNHLEEAILAKTTLSLSEMLSDNNSKPMDHKVVNGLLKDVLVQRFAPGDTAHITNDLNVVNSKKTQESCNGDAMEIDESKEFASVTERLARKIEAKHAEKKMMNGPPLESGLDAGQKVKVEQCLPNGSDASLVRNASTGADSHPDVPTNQISVQSAINASVQSILKQKLLDGKSEFKPPVPIINKPMVTSRVAAHPSDVQAQLNQYASQQSAGLEEQKPRCGYVCL